VDPIARTPDAAAVTVMLGDTGRMVPADLPARRASDRIGPNGRALPEFRAELRRIPSLRNAVSVASIYGQTALVVWATVEWAPWSFPFAFVLATRAFAQVTGLMHEAAHRLLFANKRVNDFVGRWLLGYPTFTSTDAYRRVHMAHHREEFGPDEPDMALYRGYPIPNSSFRRKMIRDATGRTGWKLFRGLPRGLTSSDPRIRNTAIKILAVQAVLLGAAIVSGHWWLYPFFWLAPYLTSWRVVNRLRSIAEHGGMTRSRDRRETTHSVRQSPVARFFMVPYNLGWHLAHHVDPGVPFRHLPRFHAALRDAGYVDDTIEHRSYTELWRRLRTDG
jgi:fatty acid desaturase